MRRAGCLPCHYLPSYNHRLTRFLEKVDLQGKKPGGGRGPWDITQPSPEGAGDPGAGRAPDQRTPVDSSARAARAALLVSAVLAVRLLATDASRDPGPDPAGLPDGRIAVNTATEAELRLLPGVGPARAAAIVRHREARGPFAGIADLQAVPGIGRITAQRLLPRVDFALPARPRRERNGEP